MRLLLLLRFFPTTTLVSFSRLLLPLLLLLLARETQRGEALTRKTQLTAHVAHNLVRRRGVDLRVERIAERAAHNASWVSNANDPHVAPPRARDRGGISTRRVDRTRPLRSQLTHASSAVLQRCATPLLLIVAWVAVSAILLLVFLLAVRLRILCLCALLAREHSAELYGEVVDRDIGRSAREHAHTGGHCLTNELDNGRRFPRTGRTVDQRQVP